MLTLSSAEDGEEQSENKDYRENKERDLQETVGAIPLHLSCATVDDDLIDFLIQPVRARIDRQQQVLEGNRGIVGRDIVDALFVAAETLYGLSAVPLP